jgi:tetrahydromethanopterin S-methyltransferase subunit F
MIVSPFRYAFFLLNDRLLAGVGVTRGDGVVVGIGVVVAVGVIVGV